MVATSNPCGALLPVMVSETEQELIRLRVQLTAQIKEINDLRRKISAHDATIIQKDTEIGNLNH